jgi:hypothetical protein
VRGEGARDRRLAGAGQSGEQDDDAAPTRRRPPPAQLAEDVVVGHSRQWLVVVERGKDLAPVRLAGGHRCHLVAPERPGHREGERRVRRLVAPGELDRYDVHRPLARARAECRLHQVPQRGGRQSVGSRAGNRHCEDELPAVHPGPHLLDVCSQQGPGDKQDRHRSGTAAERRGQRIPQRRVERRDTTSHEGAVIVGA